MRATHLPFIKQSCDFFLTYWWYSFKSVSRSISSCAKIPPERIYNFEYVNDCRHPSVCTKTYDTSCLVDVLWWCPEPSDLSRRDSRYNFVSGARDVAVTFDGIIIVYISSVIFIYCASEMWKKTCVVLALLLRLNAVTGTFDNINHVESIVNIYVSWFIKLCV